MASPFGDYYKLVRAAFKEYAANPETGLTASFNENEDTLTLHLSVKDGDEELQYFYIWGNNPLTLMYKGDTKIFTASHEQMFDKIAFIAHDWKRSKKI